MKKILDNNWFAIPLVLVQMVCLSIGIYVAVNDSSHTSVALLFLIIPCLFLLSIILVICALVVKSTKRWLYIGLTVLWLLMIAPLLIDIFYAEYMYSEMEDIEAEMQEYEESQMKEDSIYYLDSISN